MVLTVLDKNFKPVCAIDSYESLIWTERYCEFSDFELSMAPYPELLSMLKIDYYIVSNDSYKMMIIESIEVNTGSDNDDKLIIKGRSLESILNRRVIYSLTRFGVSDHDDGEERLPALPSNFFHVKYCQASSTVETYYKTGIIPAVNDLTFEGYFARGGSLESNKSLCIFGYGTSGGTWHQNGLDCFLGTSHKLLCLSPGSNTNWIKVSYTLDNKPDTGKLISVRTTAARKHYLTGGEASTNGTFIGNIYGSNQELYVFKMNGERSLNESVWSKNLCQYGYVEIETGSYHYRYYPAVYENSGNANDGKGCFMRFKLEDGAWTYDTNWNSVVWTNNVGEFIPGPKIANQPVRVYKAATFIVDSNFINNPTEDPYWGDLSGRNISNITCQDESLYTDPAITNWSLIGSYYGENVSDALIDMLSERGLGFSLEPNGRYDSWIFKVISGKDRSYSQKVDEGGVINKYVMFSPDFGNITSMNFLQNKENVKNVAFIMGENEVLPAGTKTKIKFTGSSTYVGCKFTITDGENEKEYTMNEMGFLSKVGETYYPKSGTYQTTMWKIYFNGNQINFTVYTNKELTISGASYPSGTQVGSTFGVSGSYSQTGIFGRTEAITLNTRRCTFTLQNKTGLDRREIMVDGSKTQSTYEDSSGNTQSYSDDVYASLLRNQGNEELSQYKTEKSFEGELITEYEESQFIYRRDFNIGDIVIIKDQYGNIGNARISEMVYSCDSTGSKWYPTIQSIESEEENE